MVAFGRPKGRRGSYKQWEEGDIAPQVVFETLSPGNRPPEMQRKLEFYERYGVGEYYIYDPDDGSLEGWLRSGGRFVKVSDMSGFVSPRLRIRFEPGPGPDNLRILDPDGEPFLTAEEFAEERRAAQIRMRDAERRVETERQCAEKMAARLRELGIEPDGE